MPDYSVNWFTGDQLWTNDIFPFYRGMEGPKVFLEIGSFEGLSANWICGNMLGDGVLHCIDTWSNDGPGICDINLFLNNTTANKDKIIAHKGTSKYWLKKFFMEQMKFDFIFIDGLHDRDNVLQDAINSFDLLKVDRFMVFDDYDWMGGNGPEDRPHEAIDSFIKCYSRFIDFEYRRHHVIIKKHTPTKNEDNIYA